VTSPLYERLRDAGGDNEVLGWDGIMPELSSMIGMSNYSTFIVAIILFGVVALGVINTLFMSIYERMFEFGVLKGIGTRPWLIFRLILAEGAVLAVLSVILGSIVGLIVNSFFAHHGFDFTGLEVAGVTFQEPILAQINAMQFIKYPIWIFVLTLLAATYPAIYASRLVPAEAMRRSL